MGSGVTSRHPSKELSVVNDEVGEGELMRVEQEWGDTKTKDGNPEVDDVRDEYRHSDVKQEHQSSDTKIDRGAGESRAGISDTSCSKRQTHYRMLNDIRVVAKPRPVAMYRAPPKVKLLRIECM